jgi:L-ascorbate metabolism protein UlaG (beta-lactamase superfamily)
MADQRTAASRTADADSNLGSLLFIGNATVLLRIAGLTILTDPTFVPKGTEVPLGYGLSTTRLTDPAMAFEDLPPVDAVLLSHDHGDHFDPLVEERLDHGLPIVTTPQAARRLQEVGFRQTVPLETWDVHELSSAEGRVRITAVPGRHGPLLADLVLPDVMGSVVEAWAGPKLDPSAPPDVRLYISGDTLVFEDLREIPTRLGELDLALLHLGGTRVMGITVTMDAEHGIELIRILEPRRTEAIHYDDYDAFKEPIGAFVQAVRDAGLSDRVGVLERGQTLGLGAPRAR